MKKVALYTGVYYGNNSLAGDAIVRRWSEATVVVVTHDRMTSLGLGQDFATS